jgi:hypothetical protein
LRRESRAQQEGNQNWNFHNGLPEARINDPEPELTRVKFPPVADVNSNAMLKVLPVESCMVPEAVHPAPIVYVPVAVYA